MDEKWFCYMLRCSNNALYIGVATDLVVRIKRHNAGFGATFTAKWRPVELVWWQEFPNQKGSSGSRISVEELEAGEEVGAPVEFW